jgi:predicted nucleic acid-binding Zn finger protein
MMKYMINKNASSGFPTCSVNLGGMKNISHIRALNAAEINTGKMSNIMASKETVRRRINAGTLYPIQPDNAELATDTSITTAML